jgi:Tol biopolymer transport system component/DNA-binding CsgD family transcriptional regulator
MATRGRPPHPDILTPREWEVFELVREGLNNPQIAERLDITRAAVKYHVSEILGKLAAVSREEAAAWDPRQRPDWTPRWDPTRRPAWATALAPFGLFWHGLTGGLTRSAGALATVTSVGLGVALVAGITIFAVLVMHVSGSSKPTIQAGPAATAKIAFYSDRDGNREIYVMNADGSGQTNVSNGPGDDSFSLDPAGANGAWSPDGSRIAFTSNRDGNKEVYVVNADGSGRTRLSNNPCEDGVLAWSPDGSRIALSSLNSNVRFGGGDNPTVAPAAGDCRSTIYVVNADGSGLTYLSNGPGDDGFGAWSPDGSRIAFTSNRDGNQEIYVVNADGSGLTNLSNNPSDEEGFTSNPGVDGTVWSPDSSRIRFVSVRDGNLGLYVVNADGSGLTYLGHPGPIFGGATSAGGGWSSDLSLISWGPPSPDGSRMPFISAPDGNEELYVVNADGSGPINLSNSNPGAEHRGPWSPDSSRIAFLSDRDGNQEIYVVNADGSGQTNLTNNPGDDGGSGVGGPMGPDIAWSPDGSRIAFLTRRDGNGEIYIMNADGSGQTNLTNNPGEDYAAIWSPVR